MMRSMAASMKFSDGGSGDVGFGFEFGDRLVGKAELVEFAVLKHLYDDFEQPLVGGERIGDSAGPAQIVRSDGVSVAHHLNIHHPHSALDEHVPRSPCQTDNGPARPKFHFGKPASAGPAPTPAWPQDRD